MGPGQGMPGPYNTLAFRRGEARLARRTNTLDVPIFDLLPSLSEITEKDNIMSQLQSDDLFVGKLVRLSAPRPEDKDALAAWSNDAEYLRLLEDDPTRPRSAEYYGDRDKERENQREREHRIFEFRIRAIAEDKLIGFAALWVDWKNQTAGLGMGIGDADYRDRGYGTDALRLTVNYGFRELNLYKLTLTVFSYNPRAIHFYSN